MKSFSKLTLRKLLLSSILLGGVVVIGAAAPKPAPKPAKAGIKQVVTGPMAQYWVSASTASGLGAMMAGGKPSMGDIMGMMGGGSKVTHGLKLQLGSQKQAANEPKGDHFPADVLGTGTLPLYYKAPVGTIREPRQYEEREPEPPKGRILIFWGCSEHARPGQPVEIDLSKITDPTQRATMMRQMPKMASVTWSTDRAPSPDRFKSYGEWPNEKSKKNLTGNSSLIGAHTVKSNYASEINFTLNQAQDFLGPLDVSTTRLGSGAMGLNWPKVDHATSYYAMAIGGSGGNGADNTMVIWTSSEANIGMGGAGMDYLSPSDQARLVAQKILMGEPVTSCAVPAEAIAAAPQMMYTMTAYGGEANFAYPERPNDPNIAWNIEWTTKVRYKSTTGGVLGQDMGAMGREEPASNDPSAPKKPKKKKSLLGAIIDGVVP